MRSAPATRARRPATRHGSSARRTARTSSTPPGRASPRRPGSAFGERGRRGASSCRRGALWFAHREDGFEDASARRCCASWASRSSASTPAEVDRALAADRCRRPGLRDLRAGGRPAAGPPGRRGGRPPVHRGGRPVRARLGAARAHRRSPAARCRDRRRPPPRRRPVRVRGRAVAAAPLPGVARRPHPGDEAGRRVLRARRPATTGSTPTSCRAGSTTTPRSTASRRSTAGA